MSLKRIYIIYSGQYDIPCSKQQPYEETIRIPMYLRGPQVPINKVTKDIVGNIDILPTFLSLAGISFDEDTYDGRSWTTGVLNGVAVGDKEKDNVITSADDWRTTWLTQYQSVGTYGFSHCSTWFPASDGSVCPGVNHSPPENAPDGKPWLVDDTQENNWRAIRIINDTVNMMYVELVNHTWNEDAFNNPIFYEYYDINSDPYQLKNTYDSLNGDIKTELHEMLMKYGNCTGSNCW